VRRWKGEEGGGGGGDDRGGDGAAVLVGETGKSGTHEKAAQEEGEKDGDARESEWKPAVADITESEIGRWPHSSRS
jgi:hypothetical protein